MGRKWMEFLIQYHLEKKNSLLSDHYSKALNILLYSKLPPVEESKAPFIKGNIFILYISEVEASENCDN